MNTFLYVLNSILAATLVGFAFFANKGIRNLETHVDRDLEELWFEMTTNSIRLDREIAKREEAAAAPTVARNAARKTAPATPAAVATPRSASKVAAKKAAAKKAPAKKAAVK